MDFGRGERGWSKTSQASAIAPRGPVPTRSVPQGPILLIVVATRGCLAAFFGFIGLRSYAVSLGGAQDSLNIGPSNRSAVCS